MCADWEKRGEEKELASVEIDDRIKRCQIEVL